MGTSPKSEDGSQLNLSVSPSKTDISINNNTAPSRGPGDTVAKSNSPPTSFLDSRRSIRKNVPPEDDRLLTELVS